jgi:hypothetical protein
MDGPEKRRIRRQKPSVRLSQNHLLHRGRESKAVRETWRDADKFEEQSDEDRIDACDSV